MPRYIINPGFVAIDEHRHTKVPRYTASSVAKLHCVIASPTCSIASFELKVPVPRQRFLAIT